MTGRGEPAVALPPAELANIERDLVARFCPPLEPDAVHGALIEVLASFDAAPVRTYMAILVHRATNDRLRRAVAAGDGTFPTARAS